MYERKVYSLQHSDICTHLLKLVVLSACVLNCKVNVCLAAQAREVPRSLKTEAGVQIVNTILTPSLSPLTTTQGTLTPLTPPFLIHKMSTNHFRRTLSTNTRVPPFIYSVCTPMLSAFVTLVLLQMQIWGFLQKCK